ncbi:hypothetical protein QBC43DRAFT_82155 [Cladorrhinum sp. PSN259]|nr:hypothetical protein QBC43DRAFT_82155 [Cladorrhinum sp. PSN259]
MPVPRIAGLRSPGSLRHISISSHVPQASALVSVPFGRQCRLKSTAEPPRVAPKGLTAKVSLNGGQNGQQQQKGPRPSLWAFLWQSIRRDLKRGRQNMKNTSWSDIMRETPGEAIGGIVAVIAAFGAVGYVVYLYFTYFNSPKFTRYPEPVAQALRKALYFSNQDPDPQRALRYYKQAVDLADEHGLDQFSDDYMGIKIQLAAWLEKIQSYDNAIMILENMLSDCKRWVDTMEKAAAEGTLAKYDPTLQPQPARKEGEEAASKNAAPPGPRENFWGKRTRLLKKAVGISVKLANLYSDEHVLERETAHERIVWAVETTLRELNRRSKEPLKEGEGDWMADQEVGGALESLALNYCDRKQFHLAVPLLFQALRLSEDQCHTATLSKCQLSHHLPRCLYILILCKVGNIATAFAEHPLLPPGEAEADRQMVESKTWATPAQQRKAYLDAAERWARNAIANSKVPKGDKRTPECDAACTAAVINMGSILAQMGKPAEAKKKFEQGIKMVQGLGSSGEGEGEGGGMEKKERERYLAEAEAGLAKLSL